MFLDQQDNSLVLYPIVWVKDQVYFETACGSGSAAVALVLNQLLGEETLSMLQPSGMSIETEVVSKKDQVKSIKIGGPTKRLLSGNITLNVTI